MEKKSFVSYGVVLCPLQDTCVVSYQMIRHDTFGQSNDDNAM